MCCDDKTNDDDYDKDCYEFDVIDETEYVMEFYDFDIDDYLARGWVVNSDGFQRFDSTGYEDREYRCYPTRYRLDEFRLSKSLRRNLARNSDLKTIIRPFRPTEGKDDLHTAHHHARFDREHPRYTVRHRFDHHRWSQIDVMEVCVFDGEKMVACSFFEVSEKSAYGNCGFWDTTVTHRGLGIFTVLLEMQYAAKLGKKFYYLNHYLPQNPNFHYKTRFPALELWDWDNDRWVDFKDERIAEMFAHKFRCKDDLEKDEPEWVISLLQCALQYAPEAKAGALFGSRAKGTAREDSDYNVVVIADDIDSFFENENWARRFHRLREIKTETRGAFRVMRAFYKNGNVLEFNFATREWASSDEISRESRKVLGGGIKILHDPDGILEKLQSVSSARGK